MTEVITNLPESSESVEAQSAPRETFRGRLLRGLREAYNVLDLSAGVSLASTDIRAHTEAMNSLNERYSGLLERRTSSDFVSSAVQADIQLDFRRDVQRAGYTDVEQMSPDQRRQLAEAATAAYVDDIIAELQGHHPDWTPEEVEALAHQYAQDVITVLAMDETRHDTYQAAMLEYQESNAAITEAAAQREQLQEQRDIHLRSFGRIALQTLVAMGQGVRNAPYAVSARASVTVAGVREWYSNRSPEGKKAVFFSAAGVAVAGLVGYIASRHTGGAHGSYNLASFNVPGPNSHNHPNDLGFGHPVNLNAHPGHPDNLGVPVNHPANLDAHTGHPINLESNPGHPNNLNAHPGHPDNLDAHAGHPNNLNAHPNTLGNPSAPEIHTSRDLFGGSGEVKNWPDTITVSRWNSKTHDGSLWGISEQMLRRSGIEHPNNGQIQHLVNALRPQALPNGFLLDGQQLHLGPAVDALKDLN